VFKTVLLQAIASARNSSVDLFSHVTEPNKKPSCR